MDQKDRVFTPTFIANLFLIAGTVFLFLKGKDTFNKLGYKAKINTHTTSYIN